MVVDTGAITDSVESQAAGTQHSCHILNYVHHSSNILRKVRLGQPLDAALHSKPPSISQLKQHRDAIKPAPGKNTQPSDTLSTLSLGANFRRDRTLHRLQTVPLTVSHSFRDSLQKRYLLPHAVNSIPLKSTKHLEHYQQHVAPEDEETPSELSSCNFPAAPDHHNAALIIARFFRSVCRLDNAPDRARDVLRRRWRGKHPEKYRTPLFKLTNNEQLRVLQLYNPHLYGSQHPVSPLKSASTSVRLSRVPRMEQHKRLRQSQILARMDQETSLLNNTCRQKTHTHITATTTLHEAYQRHSPARERPKTILDRGRTQHDHNLVALAKSPPKFRCQAGTESRQHFSRSVKGIPNLKPLQR